MVFVIVSLSCLGEQALSHGKTINNTQSMCAEAMSAGKCECPLDPMLSESRRKLLSMFRGGDT